MIWILQGSLKYVFLNIMELLFNTNPKKKSKKAISNENGTVDKTFSLPKRTLEVKA